MTILNHPMPIFRTPLSPQKNALNILHSDSILCLGSCFAQHIGERLAKHKFSTLLNPFGILYHPLSISNSLQWLNDTTFFSSKDLFQHMGLWHSFAHHGQFSNENQEACLASINQSLTKGRAQLKKSKYLIVTLGTAHVFQYKLTKEVVANCHKLPNTDFNRYRLSVATITEAFSSTFEELHRQYPDLQIIVSVSPVRHLRDGHIENQRSKASLILALSELEKQFNFVHYFPAYELLLDDLRDYRFYASDMIHPNETAIDYIWNYFSTTFFNQKTKQLISEIEKIRAASQHRPFRPKSAAHQQFVEEQLAKIQALEAKYAFLDFKEEVYRMISVE